MAKRCIDYAYKSYVLNEHSELLELAKRASLYDYSVNRLIEDGIVLYALKTNKKGYQPSADLRAYCEDNNLIDELKECYKINHASFNRTRRLRERVSYMLNNGSCVFLTLTFTDSTLASTSSNERRRAVAKFLRSCNCKYVANIDFGKDKTKTMREHYHALVNCDYVSLDSWRKYGQINVERVRIKSIEEDKTKISKYIAKLSNHAIKETTRRSALLYSR